MHTNYGLRRDPIWNTNRVKVLQRRTHASLVPHPTYGQLYTNAVRVAKNLSLEDLAQAQTTADAVGLVGVEDLSFSEGFWGVRYIPTPVELVTNLMTQVVAWCAVTKLFINSRL